MVKKMKQKSKKPKAPGKKKHMGTNILWWEAAALRVKVRERGTQKWNVHSDLHVNLLVVVDLLMFQT